MRVKIAAAVNLFGIVVALGFFAVFGTSLMALGQLKVGGPVYHQIALAKDLVADILPPPEYVIEAYLENTLALNDPASLETHRKRLEQLHKDYTDRHDYWQGQDIEPSLRDMLTQKSDAEVAKFWQLTEGQFLPALAKGDVDTARKVYADLTTAYNAHRAIINDIVDAANHMSETAEANATSSEGFFGIVLWSVAVVVLLVVFAGVVGIALGVIRPVIGMTKCIGNLAKGDLDVAIPFTRRSDEIGCMAQAVNVLRDNLSDGRRLASQQEGERAKREERARHIEELVHGFDRQSGQALDAVSSASSALLQSADNLSRARRQCRQRRHRGRDQCADGRLGRRGTARLDQ